MFCVCTVVYKRQFVVEYKAIERVAVFDWLELDKNPLEGKNRMLFETLVELCSSFNSNGVTVNEARQSFESLRKLLEA